MVFEEFLRACIGGGGLLDFLLPYTARENDKKARKNSFFYQVIDEYIFVKMSNSGDKKIAENVQEIYSISRLLEART